MSGPQIAMAVFSNVQILSIIQLSFILPLVSALGDTVRWINPKAAIIGDVILIQGGQRWTDENGSDTLLPPSATNYLYNISLNCSIATQGSNAQTIDNLIHEISQTGSFGGPKIWWGGGLFWNAYEFYTFG